MPDTNESPIRAFLGGIETITRALLRASDACHHADVEGMLDLLHQQSAALTPWADARICTSCWHAIPAIAVGRLGGDHRGICAACLADGLPDDGGPDYMPSEN
jgi:hypothetical protein